MFVGRCLRHSPLKNPLRTTRTYRITSADYNESDSCGIPLRPTWSVNTLLSSYPTPTISSATLSRLHELSALVPPPDGTQEYANLKREMEDIIRLVEAVKLVDTKDVQLNSPHEDQNADQQHDNQSLLKSAEQPAGRTLLNHASRTLDGFYVVDADRR